MMKYVLYIVYWLFWLSECPRMAPDKGTKSALALGYYQTELPKKRYCTCISVPPQMIRVLHVYQESDTKICVLRIQTAQIMPSNALFQANGFPTQLVKKTLSAPPKQASTYQFSPPLLYRDEFVNSLTDIGSLSAARSRHKSMPH